MRAVKPAFVAASLALVMGGPALAAPYQTSFVQGGTLQDIRTRIGPPPEICKRVSGPEACVAVFSDEGEPDGPVAGWLFVGWWPAKDTECIDQATAKEKRDCTAADAVPILTKDAQMELMSSMARPPRPPRPQQ